MLSLIELRQAPDFVPGSPHGGEMLVLVLDEFISEMREERFEMTAAGARS